MADVTWLRSAIALLLGDMRARRSCRGVAPPSDELRHRGDTGRAQVVDRNVAVEADMEVLHRHRRSQSRAREAAGSAWTELDLVFTQEDGTRWTPPAVTLAFHRAVRSAGVRRVRLHDLRHSHASLLLAAGVDPKVVSERLGHSSVAFTLDTYAHVMPGMQLEAAEMFDALDYGHDASQETMEDPNARKSARKP